MKVSIDSRTICEVPNSGDRVVMVQTPGQEGCLVHLTFEPTRSFYAKNLIANGPWLIKRGFGVLLTDFKRMILGKKPRHIETIYEYEKHKK
jgi:hypothetical protein